METACQHLVGQIKGLEGVGSLLLGGSGRHPLLYASPGPTERSRDDSIAPRREALHGAASRRPPKLPGTSAQEHPMHGSVRLASLLCLTATFALLACDRAPFRAAPRNVAGGSTFAVEIDGEVFEQGGGALWTIRSLNPDVVPMADIVISTPSATPGDLVYEGLPTRPVEADTLVRLELSNGAQVLVTHVRVLAPRVHSVQLPAAAQPGGASTAGVVHLTSEASSAGALVHLVSMDPDVVKVPATVAIPPGHTLSIFPIRVAGVPGDREVEIGAYLEDPPSLVHAPLSLTGVAADRFELAESSPAGGNPVAARLFLDGPAPVGGVDVPLQVVGTDVSGPPTLHVPEGADHVPFELDTQPVTSKSLHKLIATYGAGKAKAVLYVDPPRATDLLFHPRALRGGRGLEGELVLDGPAGPGGVSVPLSSGSPSLTLPPSVVVPEGERGVFFGATAAVVGSEEDVQATAGPAATGTLKILPPASERVFVDADLAQDFFALPPHSPGAAPRPVGVMSGATGEPTHFVRDEIILLADDYADVTSFLATYGGTVLSVQDPQAHGLLGTPSYVIQVDPSTFPTAGLDGDLMAITPNVQSELRFGDSESMGLFAMAADARLAGYETNVNFVFPPAAIADKTTQEAAAGTGLGGEPYSRDAFEQDYLIENFSPSHAVTTAWGYLERAQRDQARIGVGIIDAGFMSGDPDMPADRIALTAAPGNTALDSPNMNDCSGGNPCPWHGTNTAQIAAGLIDNGLGVAGTGGQVVQPITVVSWMDSASARDAMQQAVAAGARIINMSFGGPIPAASTGLADMMNDDTQDLFDDGIIVIASAGNSGVNVDSLDSFGGHTWEEEWWYPCENDGVTCVGGLNHASVWRDTRSNFGIHDVDIWAPFTLHGGARTDMDPTGASAPMITGTSFSAPFVAGVLAMVMAAEPSLTGQQAHQALIDRAADSIDGSVRRVVKASEAVREALVDAPVDVQILEPLDGAAISAFPGTEFSADVNDREDSPTSLVVEWTSDRDGFLGTGRLSLFSGLSPGTHVITATATDSFGWTVSDSVQITVSNMPPFMEILTPENTSQYFVGESIFFSGEGFDLETFQPLAPGQVWWVSSIDGHLGTGYQINAALSAGTHDVFIYGTDPDGATGSVSIEVDVVSSTNTAPQVTITFPSVNPHPLPATQGIHLQAVAFDAEDGNLSNAIQWYSNFDGYLGTGPTTYWVPSFGCGITEHTVRAEVTDSDGTTRQAVTEVHATGAGPC